MAFIVYNPVHRAGWSWDKIVEQGFAHKIVAAGLPDGDILISFVANGTEHKKALQYAMEAKRIKNVTWKGGGFYREGMITGNSGSIGGPIPAEFIPAILSTLQAI